MVYDHFQVCLKANNNPQNHVGNASIFYSQKIHVCVWIFQNLSKNIGTRNCFTISNDVSPKSWKIRIRDTVYFQNMSKFIVYKSEETKQNLFFRKFQSPTVFIFLYFVILVPKRVRIVVDKCQKAPCYMPLSETQKRSRWKSRRKSLRLGWPSWTRMQT